MNICIIDRLFLQSQGGVQTYTYYLTKALTSKDHFVHIICEEGDFRIYSKDFFYNVRVHQINFKPDMFAVAGLMEKFVPFHNLRFAKAVYDKLQEVLLLHHIDVVEASEHKLEPYFILRLKEKPVVIRLQGEFPVDKVIGGQKNATESFREKRSKKMIRNMLLSADGLTAASDDLAAIAKQHYSITKPVEIIPNGIDVDSFIPGNFEQRELNVFFCGRLEKKNGIAALAQAIPLVLKKFPQTKFILAGRDSKEDSGEKMWGQSMAQQIPPENLILLKEIPMENLRKYFQKNAIAVFPALYEAFGYLTLESMACGCATIAAHSGLLKEFISHGEDGLLIRPGDPEELAQSIILLLSDAALRQKISTNGVTKVRTRFNLEEVSQRIGPFYEKTRITFDKMKTELAKKPFL